MENHIIGEGLMTLLTLMTTLKEDSSVFAILLEKWKEFGRNLGISDTEIVKLGKKLIAEQIELDDIPYKVLAIWKGNTGREATLQILHDVLVSMGLQALADKLKSLAYHCHHDSILLLLREQVLPPKQPKYYITRNVSYRFKLSTELYKHKSTKDHIFLIKGVSMHELGKIAGDNESKDSSGNWLDYNKSKNPPRFLILQADSDFKAIAKKSKKPVHHIEVRSGEHCWIRSSKCLDIVRRHLQKNPLTIVEDNLITEWNLLPRPRVFSFADSPGMGKTLLLANLANNVKQNDPSTTAIFIVLQEFIHQIQSQMKSSKAAIQALSEYACKDGTSSKALTQQILNTNSKYFDLFLDGYDEIKKEELSVANKFLKQISNIPNVNIYVTTRPHLSNQLANIILSNAYEIQPFDESKQVEFLTKYWIDQCGANEGERLTKFALSCLSALQQVMSDKEKDIAGIPLQCMMLAEVYADDATRASTEESIEFIPKVNSIFDMYKCLVDLKFKRVKKFEKEVKRSIPKYTAVREKYYQYYVYESIKLLFPDWLEKLEKHLKRRDDVDENFIYSIGLIEKSPYSNVPRFVHRTFAEYLIADFLVHHISKCGSTMEFVFGTILGAVSHENSDESDGPSYYKFAYPNITYFFEHHLRLHIESYSIDYGLILLHLNVNGFIAGHKDVVCKSLVACSCSNLENCFDLVRHVFFCYNFQPDEWTQLKAKYFQYLPHLTIHHSKSLTLLQKVLNLMKVAFNANSQVHFYEPKGVKTNDPKFSEKSIDLYTYPWITGCTPLHVAIFHGCYDVVEFWMKQDEYEKEAKYFGHVCVRDSADDSDILIDNKVSILELLYDKNKAWLDETFEESGCSPLLQKNVHLKLLKKLVTQGANINMRSKTHGTLLQRNMPNELDKYNDILRWAFSSGYTLTDLRKGVEYFSLVYAICKKYKLLTSETLDVLKEAGADINAVNKDRDNLLLYLLQRKHCYPNVIEEVLKYGVNVNHKNKYGKNSWDIFFERTNELGSAEIEKILTTLITHGYNGINEYEEGHPPATPLLSYIRKCFGLSMKLDVQVLEMLHRNGADFNAMDKDSNSVLLTTIQYFCRVDFVKSLLDYGADVNHQNQRNESVAHCIFKEWRKFITSEEAVLLLELLLSRGFTKLDEPDDHGNTPLLKALAKNYLNEEVLETFLKNGASFTTVNGNGDSAILLAIKYKQNKSIIEKLIEYGSDVYHINNDQRNALHFAAGHGNLSVLKMFVDKFDINCTDNDENTPLHLLLTPDEKERMEALELLLSKGANLNAKNRDGNTPIEEWTKSWRPSALGKLNNSLQITKEAASKSLTYLIKERSKEYWFFPEKPKDFLQFLFNKKAEFLLPNGEALTWSKLNPEQRAELEDVKLTQKFYLQLQRRTPCIPSASTNNTRLSDFLNHDCNVPVSEVLQALLDEETWSSFEILCDIVKNLQ